MTHIDNGFAVVMKVRVTGKAKGYLTTALRYLHPAKWCPNSPLGVTQGTRFLLSATGNVWMTLQKMDTPDSRFALI